MNEKTIFEKAAIEYAKFGWSVLPVHGIVKGRCTCNKPSCKKGKHPTINRWTELMTTDPAQIKEWARLWPNANVGIATGPCSGIFVLDVDGDEGLRSLKALEDEHGKLPRTRTARTGSGGTHYLFKHPLTPVSNRGGFRPGLDVRGQGGMIVAPPSRHSCGGTYEWTAYEAPVDAPDWLLRCIQQHANQRVSEAQVEQYLAERDNVIPKGTRNPTLASIAGKLRWNGLDEQSIAALLFYINDTQCSPELTEAEVISIAASIARKPTMRMAKNTWWYQSDASFYIGDQRIRLLRDYQRDWYRTLRDISWGRGGVLPAGVTELCRLANPTSDETFREECGPVLELFRRVDIDGDEVLIDEVLVRGYIETTLTALKKSKAGRAKRGGKGDARETAGE